MLSTRSVESSTPLQRHSRELMRDYGITGQQFGVLYTVARSPGISLNEISESMYLHVGTVSGIIDRLENAGYLIRARSETDRRALTIRLTEAGEKTIDQAPVSAFGYMMRDIELLSADDLSRIADDLELLLRIMKVEDEEVV